MQPSAPTYDLGAFFEVFTAALCPLSLAAAVSYLVGLFVFGPLHARAAWTPPQTSFRIADILILILQIQIVGGIVFALARWWLFADDPPFRMAATVITWALVGFWWWTGVRMLVKARVARGPQRLIFLSVMVPVGYLCALGVVMTPLVGVACISLVWEMIAHGEAWLGLLILLLIAANVAVFGGLLGVRRYTQAIVEQARDDVALGEGIAFGDVGVAAVRRLHQPMASDAEVRFVEEKPAEETSQE